MSAQPNDGGPAFQHTAAQYEARIEMLVQLLERTSPFVRGWSGVIRRQHGHHSQSSAIVDACMHDIKRAISNERAYAAREAKR